MVILDEAQNATTHELKMFLTRIGDRSTVVVNGDVKQTDLGRNSGLGEMINLVNKYDIEGAGLVEFDISDCVRSGIVRIWLEVCDKEGL